MHHQDVLTEEYRFRQELPVKEPHTNDYRPAQDLREVNKRVITIHPTVPNFYTLLSTLPPDRQWYTFLDLKDAFFSLPLIPKNQMYFAFQWQDPEIWVRGQLTWTWLLQGFKNSPMIFDETLQNPKSRCKSVAAVPGLLVAAADKEACLRGTENLL